MIDDLSKIIYVLSLRNYHYLVIRIGDDGEIRTYHEWGIKGFFPPERVW